MKKIAYFFTQCHICSDINDFVAVCVIVIIVVIVIIIRAVDVTFICLLDQSCSCIAECCKPIEIITFGNISEALIFNEINTYVG